MKVDYKERVKVEFKKVRPGAQLPTRAHDWDAGWDAYAYSFDKGVVRDANFVNMAAGDIVVAHLGFAVSIPKGYFVQVVPRSGLALRYGLTIVNSPGTIDAGYQGEVLAILAKFGGEHLRVKRGERICQLVLHKVTDLEWVVVDEFSTETERGANGLGSTGRD